MPASAWESLGLQDPDSFRVDPPVTPAGPLKDDRTLFAKANDWMIDAGNAAASLAGAGVSFVSPDGGAAKSIADFIKEGEGSQSDYRQKLRAELGQLIEDAKAKGDTGTLAWLQHNLSNPVTELLPQAVGNFGPFAAAGKVAGGLGAARAAAGGATAAEAATAGTSAALGATSTLGGVVGAGGVRQGYYEEIQKATDEQLLKESPEYAKLRETMYEQDAKKTLGGQMNPRLAAGMGIGGTVGVISGRLGAEQALFGKNPGFARTVGAEVGGEFVEGATQQGAQNFAVQGQMPSKPLMDDVLLGGVQEAVIAVPGGIVAGAMHRQKAPEERIKDIVGAPDLQSAVEATRQAIAGLGVNPPAGSRVIDPALMTAADTQQSAGAMTDDALVTAQSRFEQEAAAAQQMMREQAMNRIQAPTQPAMSSLGPQIDQRRQEAGVANSAEDQVSREAGIDQMRAEQVQGALQAPIPQGQTTDLATGQTQEPIQGPMQAAFARLQEQRNAGARPVRPDVGQAVQPAVQESVAGNSNDAAAVELPGRNTGGGGLRVSSGQSADAVQNTGQVTADRVPAGQSAGAIDALNSSLANQRKQRGEDSTQPAVTAVDPETLPTMRKPLKEGGATLSKHEFETVKKFADLFGKKVELFRHNDPTSSDKFDGAVLDTSDTIYLNADARDAHHLVVVGHEVGHKLKEDAPDLYKQLETRLKANLSDGNLANFARYYGKTDKELYAQLQSAEGRGAIVEEFISDLIGNRSAEYRTMLDIFGAAKGSKDAGMIYKVAQFLVDFIDGLMARINRSKFVTDTMVKDLDKVRREVRAALKEYAVRQNKVDMQVRMKDFGKKDAAPRPESKKQMVLQNRDRSTPASVAQMSSIAAKPDYGRLGFSRDFANGAPVVAGSLPDGAVLGKTDVAIAADGRRIPVQYAAVEAADVLPSNQSDGSANAGYATAGKGLRAIAGNGRIAGLQSAFKRGSAKAYVNEMKGDSLHGIDRAGIEAMKAPILVRVMPQDAVTKDIGDVSNTVGNLDLSAVEQAKNDANRVDLEGLEFSEDGSITPDTIRKFVQAMPASERGGLIDTDGQATRQAVDRLTAAIFSKAYQNDELVRLHVQAQDPEARVILGGMSQAAPRMVRLDGLGAMDLRPLVVEAAQVAINARRQGVSLERASKQVDMGVSPDTRYLITMFANNSRSQRNIAGALSRLANSAYAESNKPLKDLFGAVPRLSKEEILGAVNEQQGPEDVGDAGRGVGTQEVGARRSAERSRAEDSQRNSSDGQREEGSDKELKKSASRQTDTPAFKEWFKQSTVVNEDGTPKVVYHGTTNDFSSFNKSRGNIESDFGAGFYFSSTPEDVAANYAGEGPDLSAKIEYLAERIQSESDDEISLDEAKSLARKQLSDGQPNTIPAYLSIKNPVTIGTKAETFFDEETEYNEDEDEYSEPTGKLVDFVNALRDVDADYGEFDAEKVAADIFSESSGEGLSASKLVDIFSNSEGAMYAVDYDKDGSLASKEILRKAFEGAGFDGIVDHTVNQKFGSEKRIGKQMDGMKQDTVHYIAFNPTQIKSSIGNDGSFSAENPDIRRSAQRQTDTPAFRKWFEGSVVTKDGKAGGEPLVVYHGTPEADITEFKSDERGSYFTDKPAVADGYTDHRDVWMKPGESPAIYPAYLSMQNPLQIDALGKRNDNIPVPWQPWKPKSFGALPASAVNIEKALSYAKDKGHDGLIVRDVIDTADVQGKAKSTVYAVLKPTQIKSAIGNTGKFDPTNPDIRKSGQRAPSLGQLNPAQEAAAKAVGAIVKPQTKKEAFDKFKANLGLRLRQGIVDQFAAIKEIDPAAYRLARMSKNESGPLEALMMYGKPTIKDGIYDVKIDPKGGFAKVLADLDGEHDRFLLWVAAKRADRLKAEGRENLFTDTDISSLKTLNKGREVKFDKALLALNEYNESTLKIAMDSGLIDQEAYDTMKSQPYVPFYRVMDDGIGASGPRFSSGLKGQSAFKKLKGGTNQLNQDLLSNVMQNWSHLYAASARNRAMDASVAAAEKIGIAYPVASGTKNAVKFMRGGVTQHYLIEDDYLFEAVSAVEAQTPSWMKGFSAFKTALTVGVTASPTFRIRNLIRDSIAVIGQSEIGVNPLTNVKAGMKALEKDSQTRASLIAGGGVIRFGAMLEGSNQTNRLIEKQMKKGVVLNQSNWKKLTGQMGDLWDAYQEIGDKAEGANRAALYEQLRAKGKSHAEASFMSRDLMDFSMSGRWPVVRFLAQSIPFFNARLVGLDKLGRSFKDNPHRMYYTAAALSIASIALAAAQGDDEDFKKLEDWRRDAFWNFKVGGMMFSIPKPFELGAIGTLAERTFELAFDKEMTGKRYRERLSAMLTQTFAMSPIPQIAKPLIDVWSNKDSFTGRAIETMGMDRLRPQDRYNERTSAAAKLLGQMGLPNPASLMMGQYSSLSPVQIDSLVKGYFGWLGVTTTSALEYGLRPMTDGGTKPSMQLRDVFLAGSFVESLPSGSSRYVTQFYDQAKEIEQAYASYRDALKRGDTTKAMEIMESDRDKIVKHGLVSGASKSFANYNSQTKQIMASKLMSPDEKRRMLDYIAAQKNRLAESVRLN